MHGRPTDYNGLYEFDCSAGCTFEVAEGIKGYDVDLYTPNKDELTATPNETPNEWVSNLTRGPIKVKLTNVSPYENPKSNKVTVAGADYSVELFWGNITGNSDINTKFSTAVSENKFADVIGYLNAYTKSPAKMQVFIRSADDITLKDPVYVAPTSVAINDVSSTTFETGKRYKMNATVLPEDCTNKNLLWESSDTDVGYMDGDRFIAVSAGTTEISVSCVADGTVSDSVYITVCQTSNFISELILSPEMDNLSFAEDYWVADVLAYSADESSTVFSLIYDDSCDTNFVISKSWANGAPASDDDLIIYKPYEIFGLNNYYGIDVYVEGVFEVDITEENSGLSIKIIITATSADVPTLTDITFSEDNIEISVDEAYYVTVYPYPSGAVLPELNVYADDESVVDVTCYGVPIQVYGLTAGFTCVYVKTLDGTIINFFNVYVTTGGGSTQPTSTTVDFNSISTGSYNTNFGRKSVDGITYGYYRAKSSGTYWTFYPSANLVSSGSNSLPGGFYNDDATYQIESLDITYYGSGVVKYGDVKSELNTTTLTTTSSFTTVTIDIDDSYYWFVEANNANLYVKKIVVNYTEEGEAFSGDYVAASRENTRIDATRFEGELVDGVSYVDVPTAVSISGGEYTVTATKRYTYYSYSYVEAHSSELDLDEIALTDPVDVANYYIAFKCAPANYGNQKNVDSKGIANNNIGTMSNVNYLFGDKARCLQQFDRTDGYAVGLPYVKASGSSKPIYLEFDFASNDNYNTSGGRDVSRVVLWTDGWTNTNGDPVATMTDDHYVTFREYNNYGGWNLPFDSKENSYKSYRTGYYYGSTTTLVKA